MRQNDSTSHYDGHTLCSGASATESILSKSTSKSISEYFALSITFPLPMVTLGVTGSSESDLSLCSGVATSTNSAVGGRILAAVAATETMGSTFSWDMLGADGTALVEGTDTDSGGVSDTGNRESRAAIDGPVDVVGI